MVSLNQLQFNNISSFNETQTLISGDHGTGKSTLAKCQFDQITGSSTYNPLVPSWAIILDDRSNSLRKCWLQNDFFDSELFSFRNDLEALMSNAITTMLELKIENNCSKFYGLLNDTQTIQATINDNGSISIINKETGSNIDNLFIAVGETTVITTALVYAIRNVLKCELPLIADAIFAPLDSDLRKSCFEFITNMFRPSIILENPYFFEYLSLKEDYRIYYDTELGSHLI